MKGYKWFAYSFVGISLTAWADSGGVPAWAASAQQQPLTLANLRTQPLNCVFKVTGSPDSSAAFDPVANTVTTTTGNPPVSQTISNILIVPGLSPYGNAGITFVAFGDVPLFSISLMNSSQGTWSTQGGGGKGSDHQDSSSGQIIIATWNLAPGGPQSVLNTGTCQVKAPCACVDHDANQGPNHNDQVVTPKGTKDPDDDSKCNDNQSGS